MHRDLLYAASLSRRQLYPFYIYHYSILLASSLKLDARVWDERIHDRRNGNGDRKRRGEVNENEKDYYDDDDDAKLKRGDVC